MKILVLSGVSVPPVIAGSCQCIARYCKLLEDMGHDVTFLFSGFATDKQIEEANEFWHGKYKVYRYSTFLRFANLMKRNLITIATKGHYSIGYYYPIYGLDKFVKRLLKSEHFDAIIVNYVWMSDILEHVDIKNKFIFTHDKFTNKNDIVGAGHYFLSARQERKGLSRADKILSIQSEESSFFSSLIPEKKTYTVFCPYYFKQVDKGSPSRVLFFSGDSDLNRNGISHFVKFVWPYVIKEFNSAELLIGGGICKSIQDFEGIPGVRLLGYVDNVEEFYRQGSIAINPVYQGTGLKIKTLEALAYGRITIVHPHSVEGIYNQELSPVKVANTDEQYAQLIIKAMEGGIDFYVNNQQCEQYISQMNEYIRNQYKLALSE